MINFLEAMRLRAYACKSEKNISNELFQNALLNGEELAIIGLNNQDIVAGCYISNSFHSLFIEELFVDRKYQEQGLRYGQKLLLEVLKEKIFFEKYYQQIFLYSRLMPGNNKAEAIYKKMGYLEAANGLYLQKRIM